MNALLRLFRFAAPYRLRFVWAIVAMLLYAAAHAGLLYLVKPILDNVLPHAQKLARVSTLIIVFYVAKGIGAYFSAYLMTDIGQRVVRDLRNDLFGHILNQSAAFFGRRTSGQLMSHMTNDVNQVQNAVSETVGDLIREGLALIGYTVALFYLDYRLALVVVTGTPVVVYPLVRLGQRIRRTSRRSQEQLLDDAILSVEQVAQVIAEQLLAYDQGTWIDLDTLLARHGWGA